MYRTGMDVILYAIGGHSSSSGYLNTAEAYNTATGQWAALTPMPTARGYLGVTGMDGILYAIGGYSIGSVSDLNTAEAYII